MTTTAVAATRVATFGSSAPNRLAEASQPVSTQTRRNAAGPVAAQPCGATGVKRAPSTWGADSTTVTTSSRTSTEVSTSCAPAEARSPAVLSR